MIDLHMHSTASDGALEPLELAAFAAGRGVTRMALTDHDTFAGSDLLRDQADLPVQLLPGIELSLLHPNTHTLHLLGYTLAAPERQQPLRARVRQLAEARLTRGEEIAKKLEALGFALDWEAIRAGCGGTLGRPHIAKAMVDAGYAGSTREVFDRWIGNDGPAYVEGEKMSMEEALPLLRQSGFLPVLAHPRELQVPDEMLRVYLRQWQEMGLRGVEVYHPSADTGSGYAGLYRMAREMGFLVTGGSDFHRHQDGKHGEPGCTAPFWQTADADWEALQQAVQALA